MNAQHCAAGACLVDDVDGMCGGADSKLKIQQQALGDVDIDELTVWQAPPRAPLLSCTVIVNARGAAAADSYTSRICIWFELN